MQEAYHLACSKSFAGGGYLPWLGVPTLARGYLPWLRGTYLGQGVPTLAREYLPWPGGTYPGWGYLPWPGGTYLDLPWPGEYLPWLGGTYLGWRVPTLAGGYPPWPGGTYLGQGGYPPQVWTDRHLWKQYLPVVLRTRAVKIIMRHISTKTGIRQIVSLVLRILVVFVFRELICWGN